MASSPRFNLKSKENPNKPTLISMIANANKVLNKAGVYLKCGICNQTDTIDYDSNGDGKMSTVDQSNLHMIYSLVPKYVNKYHGDYKAWIVAELGVDENNTFISGRATSTRLKLNTLTLDAVDIDIEKTLAHEIGHGCFVLWHPDSYEVFQGNSINPVCCFGMPKDQSCCWASDLSNFMWKNTVTAGTSIRAYEFKQMHRIQ